MKTDKYIIDCINKYYDDLLYELSAIEKTGDENEKLILKKAMVFDFLQIGENVSKLSDNARAKINKYDLRGVIDIRNIIVHGYGSLNYDLIVLAVKNDLPNLIKQVKSI